MNWSRQHFENVWAAKSRPAAQAGPRTAAAARLLPGGACLLDVGGGAGGLAAAVAARYTTAVTLDIARRPLPAARAAGASALQADFSAALPLAGESMDAITCLSALQYADDPRPALGEFRRLLRPGGVLVLIVPNMRVITRLVKLAVLGRFPSVSSDPGYDGGTRHYFCLQDVVDLMTGAGFQVDWLGGLVPRPGLAAALPEGLPGLRRMKAEFFCAEIMLRGRRP